MWQHGAPVKPCVLVWSRAGEHVRRRAHTTHEGLVISLKWVDFSHPISTSMLILREMTVDPWPLGVTAFLSNVA